MQHRMVFFVVAVALILAIAGFLLLSYLTRDNETPGEDPLVEQPTEQQTPGEVPAGTGIFVDGTTVYVQTLPERAVSLNIAPPEPQPTAELPTPAPTETTVIVEQPVVQPTALPPAVSGGNAVIFIDYVVQPGDTLYSIADRQLTSIELMAVHGIDAVDLVPGTTIRLPVANSAVCSGARTYVVRPGDTVFSIARAYNTTTQAIAGANGLDANYRINVAQVLCIP